MTDLGRELTPSSDSVGVDELPPPDAEDFQVVAMDRGYIPIAQAHMYCRVCNPLLDNVDLTPEEK